MNDGPEGCAVAIVLAAALVALFTACVRLLTLALTTLLCVLLGAFAAVQW